jgi:hypothetical protein
VHRREFRDASICHQDVNLAEFLPGLIEEPVNVGELADIP